MENPYLWGNPWHANAKLTTQKPFDEYNKNQMHSDNVKIPIPDGLEPTVMKGSNLFGYVPTASFETLPRPEEYNRGMLKSFVNIRTPVSTPMTEAGAMEQFKLLTGKSTSQFDIMDSLKALASFPQTSARFAPLYQAYSILRMIQISRKLTDSEEQRMATIQSEVRKALDEQGVKNLLNGIVPIAGPDAGSDAGSDSDSDSASNVGSDVGSEAGSEDLEELEKESKDGSDSEAGPDGSDSDSGADIDMSQKEVARFYLTDNTIKDKVWVDVARSYGYIFPKHRKAVKTSALITFVQQIARGKTDTEVLEAMVTATLNTDLLKAMKKPPGPVKKPSKKKPPKK
jgi:hypothetical protein